MKPFANKETQEKCEEIAKVYLTGDKEKASMMFVGLINNDKIMNWEVYAMKDQIMYLIKQGENQNA